VPLGGDDLFHYFHPTYPATAEQLRHGTLPLWNPHQLLVLADSYAPGWRASVDGQQVAIHPVNHLFRGVALGAGEHRVRFEYRPESVAAGAAPSLVAAPLWLALAAWPLVRAAAARSRPRTPPR
jgi:hypothetical protein